MCRLGHGILMLDLWVLLRMKRLICFFIKWLHPVMKILCLMALGAGLLFAYAFVNVKDNLPPLPEQFDYRKSSSCSQYSGVTDSLKSSSSSVEKELVRLKTKAFSLENMLRKMKLQFGKFYSCRRQNKFNEMPDFASESVGGCIVDTPDTEQFYQDSLHELNIFGIPIWRPNYHTPRKIIQPWTQAGECWSFKGSQGKITIDLARSALITHVTLEHIPAFAALTGTIDSAPKQFSLLGQVQNEFICIDSFIYNVNGPPSQTFPIKNKEMTQLPFKRVQLEIHSNWGNPEYTCIYRFKVHGKLFEDSGYL